MTKTGALTTEQWARFPEWIERCTSNGLLGAPTSGEQTERAIGEMYDNANAPRVPIVHVPTPVIGALAAQWAASAMARVRGRGVENVKGSSVLPSSKSSFHWVVGQDILSPFDGALHSRIRSAVHSVFRSVTHEDATWTSDEAIDRAVDKTVRSARRSTARSSLARRSLNDFYHCWYSGQTWVSYGPWARYMSDVLGAKVRPGPYEALAYSAGYIWPNRDFCILCDRPALERDSEGRLHAEDGMAIQYRDGWGIYKWHGVTVPEELVLHPESITMERIATESNSEIRRVMVERYGELRFIAESEAQAVHSDDYGTLYVRKRAHRSPFVIVKVVNSTPSPDGTYKDYFLRCHPELRPMRHDGTLGEPQEMTAKAAVASTFGMTADEYAPCHET